MKTIKRSPLYEVDETAWLEEMSRLVRERRFDKVDSKNLSMYLLDMAKRDRREVANRLITLLTHLLKWDYQPRKRSRSWASTITTQRQELEVLLDSKTLTMHAQKILATSYAKAVKRAMDETGMDEDDFPPKCPFTLDEVLSSE